MNFKEGVKFIKLMNIAKYSSGFLLYKDLQYIRSSYLIYYENKNSLKKSLKIINERFSDYENYNDSEISRWKRQRIIIKDLYNLISSAQNFTEHIKRDKEILDISILFKFFRELRNMLVHQNSFELITRRIFTKDENKRVEVFQSMGKSDFLKYLEKRMKEMKDKKRIVYFEEIISYLNNLDDNFNFENILLQYCNGIDSLYRRQILNFTKENVSALNDFSIKVLAVHQIANNLPINKTENRYLRYLITKAINDKSHSC